MKEQLLDLSLHYYFHSVISLEVNSTPLPTARGKNKNKTEKNVLTCHCNFTLHYFQPCITLPKNKRVSKYASQGIASELHESHLNSQSPEQGN